MRATDIICCSNLSFSLIASTAGTAIDTDVVDFGRCRGVIVIAIAMILKRSVLSPLAEVANNFEHYAGRGDLSNRLKVSGPFEIKQLAASANIMLDEIQSLNEQLQEMAQVDDLTGLLNKRYFYELYFCQFQRAQRNGCLWQ